MKQTITETEGALWKNQTYLPYSIEYILLLKLYDN